MIVATGLLLLAYLLGSLSGSLLLGRLRGVDIRRVGSGNAGGTNALRTQGAWFALGTVLIDVGKGALAAWLGRHFLPAAMPQGWCYAIAFAAAVGHVWPVFHGFRGGKGAATLVGGLAVLWPQVLLPALVAWLLSLVWTGYVGFATMMAGMAVFLAALVWRVDGARICYALASALFLVFTHRSNIARLRRGTEPCFERARLLGRLLDRTR
ncbi:MAG: glycerol-3-phosphate 1-O-acyltransferase PlsY [Arenimonas sp.]